MQLPSPKNSIATSFVVFALMCIVTEGVHSVPLIRKRVPVTRNGKIVSYKTMYAGEVQVGVPSQFFSVVFDTGSGHVVLPSTECNTKQCTIHRRYNQSISSTAVSINIDKTIVYPGDPIDEITVSYGTGEIIGDFVKERVCLGEGTKSTPLSCVAMGVIQATELTENPFSIVPVDGIFGLGLNSLALDPDFSFFDVMFRSQKIKSKQFSMFIAEGDTDSELIVGGYKASHLASPVQWTSVAMAEHGHWQISLVNLHIGKRKLDLCKDGSCRAIMDTGTSHLGIPVGMHNLVDQLLTTVAGDAHNCKNVDAPIITLELADFNLTLTPYDYMRVLPIKRSDTEGKSLTVVGVQPENATGESRNLMTNTTKRDPNDRLCKGLLMPVALPEPLGPNLMILGEPLLRRYYTIFDWAKPALGFGLAAPASQTEDDTLIFMQQGIQKSDGHSMFQMVIVSKTKDSWNEGYAMCQMLIVKKTRILY